MTRQAPASKAPARKTPTAKPTSNASLAKKFDQLQTDHTQLRAEFDELNNFLRQQLAQQMSQQLAPVLQDQLQQKLAEQMSSVPLSQLAQQISGQGQAPNGAGAPAV